MVGLQTVLLDIQCKRKSLAVEITSVLLDYLHRKIKATSTTLGVITSNMQTDSFTVNMSRKKRLSRHFPLSRWCLLNGGFTVGHFTVLCLVTKPLIMSESEARGEFVLIQTFLLLRLNHLLLCKLVPGLCDVKVTPKPPFHRTVKLSIAIH